MSDQRSRSLSEGDDSGENDSIGLSFEEESPVSLGATTPTPLSPTGAPPDRNLVDIEWVEADGEQSIVHATVDKLIDFLLESVINSEFGDIFVLLHPYFLDTSELFKRVMDLAASTIVEKDANMATYQKIKSVRIGNLLKKWLSSNTFRIQEQPELVDLLRTHYATLGLYEGELKKWGPLLNATLDQTLKKIAEAKEPPAIVDDIIIDHYEPDDFAEKRLQKITLESNVLEIARQMTRLEFLLFEQIPVGELLYKKFENRNKSPFLNACIRRFNIHTNWVISAIVTSTNLRIRTSLLSRFIEIAQKLRTLNNFSGVVAIVSALQATPISRLKNTWKGISKSLMSIFEDLTQLADPKGNYVQYRRELKDTAPPLLPYLGCFLKDLTFLEESPNMLSPVIVNWTKMSRVGRIILAIIRAQEVTQDFPVDETVEKYLRFEGFKLLSEKEQYRLSKEIEPSSSTPLTSSPSSQGLHSLVSPQPPKRKNSKGGIPTKKSSPKEKSEKKTKEKSCHLCRELESQIESKESTIQRLEYQLVEVNSKQKEFRDDPSEWICQRLSAGGIGDSSSERVTVSKKELLRHMSDMKKLRLDACSKERELEGTTKQVVDTECAILNLETQKKEVSDLLESIKKHFAALKQTSALGQPVSREAMEYCVRNAMQALDGILNKLPKATTNFSAPQSSNIEALAKSKNNAVGFLDLIDDRFK